MAEKSKTPGAGDAEGLGVALLGGGSKTENNLEALRAQYLSDIFGLPPDTASTVAELAFGGAA